MVGIKEGCFSVLFLMLWSSKSWCLTMLLVPLESQGCTEVVSLMFRQMMEDLLNIEQFCKRKFNKIKTKNAREIGASSCYYWKTLDEWDFLEVISWFFDLRWGRDTESWILFVSRYSSYISFSKLGSITTVVFTLEPMAQATLVSIIISAKYLIEIPNLGKDKGK